MRTKIIAFMFLVAVPGLADRVTFKNGDRLTGMVVKSDEKTLTFKSDLAGVVTAPWDAVEELVSTEPVFVSLKDGQTIVGIVQQTGEKVEIRTDKTGTVATTRSAIQGV